MKVVTVICSRCEGRIEGMEGDETTTGFYRVGPGSPWYQLGREGEEILCDPCLQSDPAYREMQGDQNAFSHPGLTQDEQHLRRLCCGTLRGECAKKVGGRYLGLFVEERGALRVALLTSGTAPMTGYQPYKFLNKCCWCGRPLDDKWLGPTEPEPLPEPPQPRASKAPEVGSG